MRGIDQGPRVVVARFERPPGEVGGPCLVAFPVLAQPVVEHSEAQHRRQTERRRAARIALDRLLQQTQRFGMRRPMHRGGAQIEVIGDQIGGRATSRTRALGGLQHRLDDARDARGDPVLQIEHVSKRTLETIGPRLRTGDSIDQVTADAKPIAALAHRAFEDIAHAELTPDLLHIDCLASPCRNSSNCAREQRASGCGRAR